MIALLVMTDGRRGCLERTLASAGAELRGPITEVWVHDDSEDPTYRRWLELLLDEWPELRCSIIGPPPGVGRSGFGGAIRRAWSHLAEFSTASFVLHLEDDFTFNRQIQLRAMADVLAAHPHIVQLALRRQPWSPAELAAGGVVELHGDDFLDRTDGVNHWLEHSRFFTTNPSLYRRSLVAEVWPEGEASEGRFTAQIRERHPNWRFAYWGARDSGEWVHHIGVERVGVGY